MSYKFLDRDNLDVEFLVYALDHDINSGSMMVRCKASLSQTLQCNLLSPIHAALMLQLRLRMG